MQKPKAKKAKTTLPARKENSRTGLYAVSTKFKRLRDAQIRYYTVRIKMQCPWLAKEDIFLTRRFAQAEMLLDVIYGQLRDKGPLTKDGEAKRLVGEWRKLVQTQGMLANQLGLSPAARAALKADPSNPSAIDISPERAQRAIDVSEKGEQS